uniref:hypothetical protein n=1 Tax=uncultured Acidovorax sp. TaxID=158751 RepID=UPI0025D2C045|nr:hypothetical protein [uncultured Acidovorax sp.]
MSVVSSLTGRPADLLSTEREDGGRPSVVTQLRCDNGQRPDLVVLLGDKPWIVVESKVEHTATIEQLASYAEWMRDASNGAPFRPTLVYLTHATPCPAGFTDTDAAFAKYSSLKAPMGRDCKIAGQGMRTARRAP